MRQTPTVRPAGYLENAERHSGRRFACREDVVILLRAAGEGGMGEEFDQLLFLAKFWERGMGVVARSGAAAEEVRQLTDELADATTRVTGLLIRLFEAGAPDASEERRRRYCSPDLAALGRLRTLLADLAALKNFELHAAGR